MNLNHLATDVDVAPSGHPGLASDEASLGAGVTDDARGTLAGAVIQTLTSEAGGNSQPQYPAPVELPSAGAGEIERAQNGEGSVEGALYVTRRGY